MVMDTFQLGCGYEHLFQSSRAQVLHGGVIPPAPLVPASIRISARLKQVQAHSSRVNIDHLFRKGPPQCHGQVATIIPLRQHNCAMECVALVVLLP